jgi:hypothetical protein
MTVSQMPAPSIARRSVTSVTSYEAAERAVDWLSDQGFPVERVSIVGTSLRYIEQVSGRLTTARAAVMGAGRGAWLGLFWGALFGLFFTVDSGGFFGVLAYSLVVGMVFGAPFGAIVHYLMRGRRDFASIARTRADRYEVQVDDSFAGEAERLLARMPPAEEPR